MELIIKYKKHEFEVIPYKGTNLHQICLEVEAKGQKLHSYFLADWADIGIPEIIEEFLDSMIDKMDKAIDYIKSGKKLPLNWHTTIEKAEVDFQKRTRRNE